MAFGTTNSPTSATHSATSTMTVPLSIVTSCHLPSDARSARATWAPADRWGDARHQLPSTRVLIARWGGAPGTMGGSAGRTREAIAVVEGELRGVIALDGPSGTGKSTVARRLAATLGAGYLDTRAMYRTVTLAVLRAGLDPTADAAVARTAERMALRISTDPVHQEVLL